MKIPAIRAKMGIWVYYVATLKFEDICKYVKPINDELHKSVTLNDLLQRSITKNFKSIASYLKNVSVLTLTYWPGAGDHVITGA